MDNTTIYWAVMLTILIIIAVLTDIGIACIMTAIIMVLKYISQSKCSKEDMESNNALPSAALLPAASPDVKSEPKTPPKPVPVLKPQVMIDNADALDDILTPKLYTADDKIFDASVVSGYKDKKAKEIRSHWNNNNWKKYYDYEMGIHETENREWWTDNDFEIGKKHVVI